MTSTQMEVGESKHRLKLRMDENASKGGKVGEFDSIPNKIKMYDFNKALKNGKAIHLLFPGTTSKHLLQYLNVNLKMCTPETFLIHAGIYMF